MHLLMIPCYLQDTDELMMRFSYEWHIHPILYDNAARLRMQSKGNKVMCAALKKAKLNITEKLDMTG